MANRPGTATYPAKAPARKPYVRIVTDKRKEQNRRAQKAYRERLKKKLEVLEEQAASALPLANGSDDRFKTVSTTEIHVDEDVDVGVAQLASPTETAFSPSIRSNPRVIDLADAFVAAGDLPFGQGSLPGIQFQVAPESPTPEPEVADVVEHTHEDYGDIDLRQIWAMPLRRYASRQKQSPTPPGSVHGSTSLMTLTPQRSSNGYQFLPPNSTIADPYMNHMHLVFEGNIEAMLTVAFALNYTRTQYINDHPSHFPGCYVALNRPDPKSPTNSISPTTVSYKFANSSMNITPELQRHLDLVKPLIRPTPAQLLNPHPSYLDCIVFPHFRDQAVKASVDGILDHKEFFRDLMNGGLVCWGGTSGLANRHGKSMKSGKRDMRDNVAWNTRSWEAKKWFLKKWMWLLGTEEEEQARGIWTGCGEGVGGGGI